MSQRASFLDQCPSCGRSLVVASHLDGQVVCCGHCQKKFRSDRRGHAQSNECLRRKIDRLLQSSVSLSEWATTSNPSSSSAEWAVESQGYAWNGAQHPAKPNPPFDPDHN